MLAARKQFPKGTVVKLSIVLPRSHGGGSDGFGWSAPRDMSAADLDQEITERLLPKFRQEFIDLDK